MSSEALTNTPNLGDDQETFFMKMFQRWTGQRFSYNDERFGFTELLQFARDNNFNSIVELIFAIHNGDQKVCQNLLSTFNKFQHPFFDDATFYHYFEHALINEMITQTSEQKKIRLWSIGSGNGTEAYSMAMVIHSLEAQLRDWSIEIIGTDFQHEMVEQAKLGRFFQEDLDLPQMERWKENNFRYLHNDEYTIAPEIRRLVNFKVHNILDDFDEMGQFNLICCRKLMKTMLPLVRENFFYKAAQHLIQGGYLALGHDESIMGISNLFVPVDGCRGLYQKKNIPVVMDESF